MRLFQFSNLPPILVRKRQLGKARHRIQRQFRDGALSARKRKVPDVDLGNQGVRL